MCAPVRNAEDEERGGGAAARRHGAVEQLTIRRVGVNAKARAEAIEARLREIGTTERAANEKRYLKSELDLVGATVWQIRSVTNEVIGAGNPLGHDELRALWGSSGRSRCTSGGWHVKAPAWTLTS
jgi:hypothetical protein